MSTELVVKRDQEVTLVGTFGVPTVIGAAGKKARMRFIEFFSAEIRNLTKHPACVSESPDAAGALELRRVRRRPLSWIV